VHVHDGRMEEQVQQVRPWPDHFLGLTNLAIVCSANYILLHLLLTATVTSSSPGGFGSARLSSKFVVVRPQSVFQWFGLKWLHGEHTQYTIILAYPEANAFHFDTVDLNS